MSFKTNELQRNAAPQLTDTLLLADSAGGTAQLSLAQAAAFFGAEMVKGGNPVGAALSSKAALSAQKTVERTNISSRTVELAAGELQGFLNGLPRLLMEDLTVRVSGSLTEPLELHNFYGSGRLTIDGGGEFSATKGVHAIWCSASIALVGMEISGFLGDREEIVLLQENRYVYMQDCTVTGTGAAKGIGINAENATIAKTANCGVKNCRIAVLAGGGSIASVTNTNDGTMFSGNQAGAYAYRGGIILLSEHAPDLLGGTVNIKGSGIIVKADGTLL